MVFANFFERTCDVQLKISDNSLFAILLRSHWWISFAAAAAVLLLAKLVVPDAYFIMAASLALPFAAIGFAVLWKQLKLPSTARVSATVEAANAMSWKEFSALVEESFQREGYTVTRLNGTADFKLVKMGKRTLVACKRWKAANQGLEPLRELAARREAEDAYDAFYVALNGVTDNARDFAAKHRIRLIEGQALAALLRLPRRGKTDTAA